MGTTAARRPRPRPVGRPDNLAELLDRLGNIPLERVRFGPAFGHATEADVLRLLEAPDKRVCELVDGFLVEKPMGFKESTIASVIVQYINNYLDENDLGLAFCPDAPIRVKPGCIRFPDTGFISWKRFPHEEFPEEKIIDAMADLAVEVLSESNTPKEMDLKLDEYFDAGVRLTWYVDPETETVTVYTSRTAKKVFTIDDVLDGGRVLPGFKLPVRKLFAKIHRRKKKR